MERTNAFVVKWQTRRNGDTFPRWHSHGISMDTKKRWPLKWDSMRCRRMWRNVHSFTFFKQNENLEFLISSAEKLGLTTSIYSWHLPKMLGGKTSMNLSDLDFKVSWRKKLHKNFHFPKFYLSHNHSRFASWSWKSYSRKKYHSVDLNSLTQVRTIISPVSKFGQSEPPKILFGAKNAQIKFFGYIHYKETLRDHP